VANDLESVKLIENFLKGLKLCKNSLWKVASFWVLDKIELVDDEELNVKEELLLYEIFE